MSSFELNMNDEHRLRILQGMGPVLGRMPHEEAMGLAEGILCIPDSELEEIRDYAEKMAPVLDQLIQSSGEEQDG